MLALTTQSGWLGAYAALAAALSLLITMWPFVAAAASHVRLIGDSAERLGLKRAAGWLALANLASLFASPAGGEIGAAWAAIVPAVNDPTFQLTRQAWAIPLDLLPFFVLSLAVEALVLWGMNLRPPKPEQVRRATLLLLAVGENVLAYLLVGLAVFSELPATLGGYREARPVAAGLSELSAAPGRVWYVPRGSKNVNSMRLDGADDRIESSGVVPSDFRSLWVVPSRRALFFVGPASITLVDLTTGQTAKLKANLPGGQERPRLPVTPAELAESLPADLMMAASEIWPQDAFRSAGAGQVEPLTFGQQKEVRQVDQIDRENWLRRFGQGRELPQVPTRPGWLAQQELQPVESGRWIVANYGYRLVILSPEQGWLTELPAEVDAFVVAPVGQPPASSSPD